MADWFKCAPLPLLDALQDMSDDAQLVFVKALLVIYHRDGWISVDALRSRFPRWRPKRLSKAIDELVEVGRLVPNGTGKVHNARAMHELQQLERAMRGMSEGGAKGGRVRAERERQARRIAERNASPDLFEPNPVENGQPDEKTNEINGDGQASLKHAHAPARARKSGLNGGSTAVEQRLKAGSTDFQNRQREQLSNEINENPQGSLKHARASEGDTDIEDSPLCSPDDEFAVPPRRKPGKPIPDDWTPEAAQLSEAVTNLIAEWPDGEFERESVKFVEDAHSNDRRHRDWDRAFGVWLTKHDGYMEERRKRHERPSGWAHA